MHPRPSRPTAIAAFSLLEISIVLAIIGLLTGGVIAGKSLLQQSKLQSVVNDFNRYNDAYKKFLTQYGGKPGDINPLTGNPTSIWGSAGGPTNTDDTTCFNALGVAGSTATCNGDGNNFIAGPYVAGALTKREEMYTAIQQLSNAKLIDGKYTGAAVGNIPAVNIPAGQIEGSGFAIITVQPITATNATDAPDYFYGNYGTVILFGSADTNGLNELLNPKDAMAIDKKMDDGLPAMGSVTTFVQYPSGIANNCVISTSGPLTAASARNAVYNASVKGKYCNLLYVIDTK